MKGKLSSHDVLVSWLTTQNAVEQCSDAFFGRYGITAAQFNILNLLGHAGGKMDQLELTRQLLVGKSSTSIVVNRMVKGGLLARSEHPVDRRRVILELTAKGAALWKKITPEYENLVERTFGKIPASLRGAVCEGCEVLRGAVEKILDRKA